MLRVPVLSKSGKPLMPSLPSRARRWLKEGKARVVHNDLECFAIELTVETQEGTQPVAVGIDPGKHYSGIGVQSSLTTLWMAHLVLPFKTVKERMELRRVMRPCRRGRRINRNLPYSERCHRQKRFDNRRQAKLPPSIRANKQLELRVVKELFKLFPISAIHYELVMADVDRLLQRSTGLIVVPSIRPVKSPLIERVDLTAIPLRLAYALRARFSIAEAGVSREYDEFRL